MTDCHNTGCLKGRDLAEQRGQLLRDMTDTWAKRRVQFIEERRKSALRINELSIRERALTWRIRELERTMLIIRGLLESVTDSEARRAIVPQIHRVLPVDGVMDVADDDRRRGGYAGAQQ